MMADYISATTDFSIPSAHREKKPVGSYEFRVYIDPLKDICLNCSLPECCYDGARDDTKNNDKTPLAMQIKEKKKTMS